MGNMFGVFMPVCVVSLTDVLGLALLVILAVLALPFVLWGWWKGRARRKRLAASMAVVDLKFKKDNSTGGRPGPGRE